MLEVGRPAPSFSLSSTSGSNVSLDRLKGKKVVLYFYPKDDTPGCTVEACNFRDNLARVRAAGAEVFGVSKDSIASHDKFRGKYDLPFELLSDPDNKVARAYGAYGKKLMYGKEVEGTIRSTFLIDERGRIERVWSPVKVEGHVDRVLEALAGAPHESIATSKASRTAKPASAKTTPTTSAGEKSARAKTTSRAKAARAASPAAKRTAAIAKPAASPARATPPSPKGIQASKPRSSSSSAKKTSGKAPARRS